MGSPGDAQHRPVTRVFDFAPVATASLRSACSGATRSSPWGSTSSHFAQGPAMG